MIQFCITKVLTAGLSDGWSSEKVGLVSGPREGWMDGQMGR